MKTYEYEEGEYYDADWAGENNSTDSDATCVYIEEGRGYSYMYDFTLYNDLPNVNVNSQKVA